MSALLEVSGVSKTFDGFRAINGLSFAIGRGERVALVGGNGAGKTTLLRTLAGIYEPVAGRLEVAGSLAPFDRRVRPEALGYRLGAYATVQVAQRSLADVSDALAEIPEVLG